MENLSDLQKSGKIYYQGRTDFASNLIRALLPNHDYVLGKFFVVFVFGGLEILCASFHQYLPLIFFGPLQLLFIGIYLSRILNALTKASEVEYYATDQGIYTRKGKGDAFRFTRYDSIQEIHREPAAGKIGSIDLVLNHLNENETVSLPFIDNCDEVYRYIISRRASQQEKKLESFTEPLIVTPDRVQDPAQSFYSEALEENPGTIRGRNFLRHTVTANEFMKALTQETVEDLQNELFGADAELTGAFPDPTVNPLPELQEDQPQDEGFMQSGL